MSSVIKLADPGVFFTIQGEGHLVGQSQVFVRAATCSLQNVCGDKCDTDFSFARRVEVPALVDEVAAAFPREIRGRARFVWLTGGEITDQPAFGELVQSLQAGGFSVAVATNGTRPVREPGIDWLSVSPHQQEAELQQLTGHEIKLVPGLGSMVDCEAWVREWTPRLNFWMRFFQPLAGSQESIEECVRLWRLFPDWGISQQSHKQWGLL